MGLRDVYGVGVVGGPISLLKGRLRWGHRVVARVGIAGEGGVRCVEM